MAAVLVVGALASAACSSDGDDDAASTTTLAPSTTVGPEGASTVSQPSATEPSGTAADPQAFCLLGSPAALQFDGDVSQVFTDEEVAAFVVSVQEFVGRVEAARRAAPPEIADAVQTIVDAVHLLRDAAVGATSPGDLRTRVTEAVAPLFAADSFSQAGVEIGRYTSQNCG